MELPTYYKGEKKNSIAFDNIYLEVIGMNNIFVTVVIKVIVMFAISVVQNHFGN